MVEEINLASFIDHTLLKPGASQTEIEKLCSEAHQHGFASVCVNPVWVSLSSRLLLTSKTKVGSVVGFPLGANLTETKVFEAVHLVQDGVQEIDMVINIGKLKDGELSFIVNDIAGVVRAVAPVIVKVIIETCLLSNLEKVTACTIARQAGAHFVKTSTGFSTGGATVEDVRLMRNTIGTDLGVKASGGIRDRETALAMIHAGANRIGTSSSLRIIGVE